MKTPAIKIETCAAKNDVRDYLNYVYFDAKAGTLSASDGHQAMRIRCEIDPGDVSCLIPVAAFAAARKMWTKRSVLVPTIRTTLSGEKGKPAVVVVSNGYGTESHFAAGEGTYYPDIDRIVPIADPVISIGLNAELLAMLQRAACVNAAYSLVRLDIVDGLTGFRIYFADPDVDVCVLMPVRL